MRKGNTYQLNVILTDDFGDLLEIDQVSVVEFIFGPVRKLYPEDVEYQHESGTFIVSLTQEDTFKMDRSIPYQARVKFADGAVIATNIYYDSVFDSLSREVL